MLSTNNNDYDHIGRERQVIELYNQGKSTRNIAKELRMSLRDIGFILVERTIEYLKDRTEVFDDYYPCRKAGLCDLLHVHKWLTLFVFMHNSIVKSSSKFHNMMR